ncbi:MAG: hypothetical protein ABH834_01865 [Candidatus Altiarchaeota archaeon]
MGSGGDGSSGVGDVSGGASLGGEPVDSSSVSGVNAPVMVDAKPVKKKRRKASVKKKAPAKKKAAVGENAPGEKAVVAVEKIAESKASGGACVKSSCCSDWRVVASFVIVLGLLSLYMMGRDSSVPADAPLLVPESTTMAPVTTVAPQVVAPVTTTVARKAPESVVSGGFESTSSSTIPKPVAATSTTTVDAVYRVVNSRDVGGYAVLSVNYSCVGKRVFVRAFKPHTDMHSAFDDLEIDVYSVGKAGRTKVAYGLTDDDGEFVFTPDATGEILVTGNYRRFKEASVSVNIVEC